MSIECIVGKSLEELARGYQIIDTPYDSSLVYELGTLIRKQMWVPKNVSISTSNSSGTVLDKGESSIASSLQVEVSSERIRDFVLNKGITQPDFISMVGDIINSGMLFSVSNVTIDRYNVSSLYEDTLTISVDFAYTKVTDFDGGKDVAKKDHTELSGLSDKVSNLATLVENMDTNFGTEVANIKKQLADSSETEVNNSTDTGTTEGTADTSSSTNADEIVDSSGDTNKDVDGPSVQNPDTVPTESAEGDVTSAS